MQKKYVNVNKVKKQNNTLLYIKWRYKLGQEKGDRLSRQSCDVGNIT